MDSMVDRRKLVEPLGSRGSRKVRTEDGGVRVVRPTVDSLVRMRVSKQKKKVVIRFNRGTM